MNDTGRESECVDWIIQRCGFPRDMVEDAYEVLMEFLIGVSASRRLLFFQQDSKIMVQTSFPQEIPAGSITYFVRRSQNLISMENISNEISFGTISTNTLDSLLHLMEGVYLPSFSHNQSWPESIKKEFAGQLQKFMSSLTETAYGSRGYTVLYIPPDEIKNVEQAAKTKELVQRLESAVIHWTRQIKEVVSNQDNASTLAPVGGQQEESESTSEIRPQPGPLEEIEFWRLRTVDLSGISDQLQQASVQTIVSVLEITSSSYLAPFLTLSKQITQRSAEAQDNLKFLSRLKPDCEKLHKAHVRELPEILPKLLQSIRTVWAVSRYYSTRERITDLLRRISNEIINRSVKCVDLMDVFEGDIQNAIDVLNESIHSGQCWKNCYFDLSQEIGKGEGTGEGQAQAEAEVEEEGVAADERQICEWSFDESAIFAQVDAFVQRCKDLLELCDGQLQFARPVTFARIEKVKGGDAAKAEDEALPKFGGARGAEIRRSLLEIQNNFIRHLNVLKKVPYHILDVKSTRWHDDFATFKAGLKDLEVMLNNIVNSAFEQAPSISESVVLLDAFAHLAQRDSVRRVVHKKIGEVFQLYTHQTQNLKNYFETNKKTPSLIQHVDVPRYAGCALWAKQILNRMNNDFDLLLASWLPISVNLDDMALSGHGPVSSSAETEGEHQPSKNLKDLFSREEYEAFHLKSQCAIILEDYIRRQFGEWQNSIDEQVIAAGYSSHILSKDGNLLRMNFEASLIRIAKEAQYWQELGFDIPVQALDIMNEFEKYRVLRESVMTAVREYNSVIELLEQKETQLFHDKLEELDIVVQPGLHRLTWKTVDSIPQYVASVRTKSKRVYGLIARFHCTRDEVKMLLTSLGEILLVLIKKKHVYDKDFFVRSQQEHRDYVAGQVEKSHQRLIEALGTVFEMFRYDSASVLQCWSGIVSYYDKQLEEIVRQMVRRSLLEISKSIHGSPEEQKRGIGGADVHPLFKLQVVLRGTDIVLSPSIHEISIVLQSISQAMISLLRNLPRLSTALPKFEELAFQVLVENSKKEVENRCEKMRREGLEPLPEDMKVNVTDPVNHPLYEKVPTFIQSLQQDEDIARTFRKIMEGVLSAEEPLNQYLIGWDRFRHIWEHDKDAFIRRYARGARSLKSFEQDIGRYRELQTEVSHEETYTVTRFVSIDCSPLKADLISHCKQWQLRLLQLLERNASTEHKYLRDFFTVTMVKMDEVPSTIEILGESLKLLKDTQGQLDQLEARFEPLNEQYQTLERFEAQIAESVVEELDKLPELFEQFKAKLVEGEGMLSKVRKKFHELLQTNSSELSSDVKVFREEFVTHGPYLGELSVTQAKSSIADFSNRLAQLQARQKEVNQGMAVFSLEPPMYKDLSATSHDLDLMVEIWDMVEKWTTSWESMKQVVFTDLNVDIMENETRKFQKGLNKIKEIKKWSVWSNLNDRIIQLKKTIPLIVDLKNQALRARHWQQLSEELARQIDPLDPGFTLERVFELGLDRYADAVASLSNSATQELGIELAIEQIKTTWEARELDFVPYKTKGFWMLRISDEFFQALEDSMMTISTLKASRFILAFEAELEHWERLLSSVDEIIELTLTVQRQWTYLESIFVGSEDIRRQLPSETQMFQQVHEEWRMLLTRMQKTKKAITCTQMEGAFNSLIQMNEKLEGIQKSLDAYLETKRRSFPRFYFLSNDELLEILGQARDPLAVQPHMRKCFENIKALEFLTPGKDGRRHYQAVGMHSGDGEFVKFLMPVTCHGPVELWLVEVEKAMRTTLQKQLFQCLSDLKPNKRDRWIKLWPGQLCLTAGLIFWTSQCQKALSIEREEDQKRAVRKSLKTLRKKQIILLQRLTHIIRGDLTPLERAKLVTIITVEVHSRDVIERMLKSGVSSPEDFDWLSQLRYYWEKAEATCIVRQTNTSLEYCYEYIQLGRLVITPLTDRCYMTLTTAMYLRRGGSPQGPAGTGKTETVKDLAKALAKMCIVFNCSEGLDYKAVGRMFSGLAQQGAYGCFDEFNRIDIEVLSVVAQQLLSILSALREELTRFIFEGSELELNSGVGVFVTMNPGYAGRTELPDNLKALFRPVSMMVPDFSLICEVMLFAEGFEQASTLANKIVTLFSLSTLQLSKQPHYDFGMRAIKAVLTSAGSAKRSNPEMSEDVVLLQTLRNTNLPKFVAQDVPLFNALLVDLFPGVELPPPEYGDLEATILELMKKKGMQPRPEIIHKIFQLYETQQARHGVMVIGTTGSGKSTVWSLLAEAMTVLAKKGNDKFEIVRQYIINPKSLSLGELFGAYDINTREWTDGVLSCVLRNASNDEKTDLKFIILDGPVDTLWIESMNTVLDDSKILTLINGERIAFPKQVNFLFETRDLQQASPATVSRCGIIYMNEEDLGWRTLVESWLNRRQKNNAGEVAVLREMVEKFMAKTLAFRKASCFELVQNPDFAVVQSMIKLYDALVSPKVLVADDEDGRDRLVELWFIFALIWSIGAVLDVSSRKKFDMFIRDLEGQFPAKDTVYEYLVDQKKKGWISWEEKVPQNWRPPAGTPFYQITVPTVDTLRTKFLLESLINDKNDALLVGDSGTGKSIVIQQLVLPDLEHTHNPLTVNFSAQTSSQATQEIIESKLEKRTKDSWGPSGGKRMICFVDDLNMPSLDEFGSQPPLELLRQWVTYGSWYDRQKQSLKYIKDTNVVAAMAPPGGGRAVITERLQSRFNVINLAFPSDSQLRRMFGSLISYKLGDFDESIRSLGDHLTSSTIEVYKTVSSELLPTPTKCHYLFNMRDLAKVFQGLMMADKDYFDSADTMIKLWVHESFRVFSDRLVTAEDRSWFRSVVKKILKEQFSVEMKSIEDRKTGALPIFCDFMREDVEISVYEEVVLRKELKELVENKLEEHNLEAGVVPMNLVLFQDALDHICRINRILKQPRGNVLLVGVGGSGRQSLTRLASYLAGYKVFQIEITRNYNLDSFREDLKVMYRDAGVDDKPTVFLFSDTQIVEESFLEDINNILSSGSIPNLFKPDELSAIREELRSKAKEAGFAESSDSVFQFFLERVRKNLHVVFCISPIGEAFRNRLRMFPALVSCVSIDWFSEWPTDALTEVGERFLEDIDLGKTDSSKVASCFVGLHKSVLETSERMKEEIRKSNYVTPTSYLELVQGFIGLLKEKRNAINKNLKKLQGGVDKLEETRTQVKDMGIELQKKKGIVANSQRECEELLVVIVQERRVADERAKHVSAENEKLSKEETELKEATADAQADLDKALPALEKATEALQALNKQDLAEVKVFARPPPLVEKVMCAVMVLRKSEPTWEEVKKQLGNPSFLTQLYKFDKNNISEGVLKKVRKFTSDAQFDPDLVGRQSYAARSLCLWVLAMEEYGKIYKVVAPKKAAVAVALEQLKTKQASLEVATAELQEITEKVEDLKKRYYNSVETKEKLKKESEILEIKLDRAAKLIEGLGGERERWIESIKELQTSLNYVVGDCIIAAGFLSYAGPFALQYRNYLLEHWSNFVRTAEIKLSHDFNVEDFLSAPVAVRSWRICGLPSDSFSTANGVLVTRGRRWPLMIDPQMQANDWIRKMEGDKLKVIEFKESDFLKNLEMAIQFGLPVLLQDIGEEIDPALDPILKKDFIKQGSRLIIKLGDKEIDYNKDFKLYITTRLSNPHYSPEISTKTTIVNFAVVEDGLAEQLLGTVVQKERPDLEEQKNNLVVGMDDMKSKLEDLEDTILELLSSASGSLLDDEQLVETLQNSKATAREIGEAYEVSKETEAKIDAAREAYKPSAERAAQLFFVLVDLGAIDPMYQFSLESYQNLFINSIDSAKTSNTIEDRISNLNDYHTFSFYKYTCRGLFERHKLLFSFLMCVKILQGSGKINEEEYQFFLRGGVVLDKSEQSPNPVPDWLPANCWDNLTELDKLDNFRSISNHVEQHTREWREFFISEAPETAQLPGEWESKCNELQRMVVVRCVRPDRVLFAVVSFISNNLGLKFVDPPAFDLKLALADSSATTPLIFVLSPGVDPVSILSAFATQRKMSDRLSTVALGQGQAPVATRLIDEGIENGHWVLLANAHLSISWLPALEEIIDSIGDRSPHPDFRLWISSDPHPKFPIAILQRSVKMTTEPPRGIKANLLRLYNKITPELLAKCSEDDRMEGLVKEQNYKRLLFALCFFHSILLERRKFMSLGFNILYDFNDSDFDISANILSVYLNQYSEIPWSALKYLTAEANYGGRVTDDWDRRLLKVYIDDLYCDAAANRKNYRLSSLKDFFIPEGGNLNTYREYIQTLPSVDHPEAFGQHINADISSQIQEASALLGSVLSVQPKIVHSGLQSREERVFDLCDELLGKLPEIVDTSSLKTPVDMDLQPLHIVLLQESARYNLLIRVIAGHLNQLKKGLKGLVIMSEKLDNIATAMYNNVVPAPWQSCFDSTKPLASWIRDLHARVDQLRSWAIDGPPKFFWIGALSFPTAFLTALLQQAARRQGKSIDSLAWQFEMTQITDPKEITKGCPLGEGAYISGLNLEGAGWNIEKEHIVDSRPMELVSSLPVIHFKPGPIRRRQAKGIYSAPCYYYPVRTGTRERPSFMIAIDLKAGKHAPEYWTKRAVAVLMNLNE